MLHEVSDTGTLRGLVHLTQLSLEDNYIDAFDGFADCPELLELYLSNNLVEELRATSAGASHGVLRRVAFETL